VIVVTLTKEQRTAIILERNDAAARRSRFERHRAYLIAVLGLAAAITLFLTFVYVGAR
jgi:hypothetical protein